MIRASMSLILVLAASLSAWADQHQPYFFSGGETAVDLKQWAKAELMQVTVNSLEVTESDAHSGKRSIKLDVTLNGDHYAYFAIPVNKRIEPGRSYYASGSLRVEQFPARGRNLIGLGTNRIIWYGPGRKRNISGSYLFDSVRGPTSGWVVMESTDLGREAPAAAASGGLPVDTIDIDNIFLAIQGEFAHDRVIVYLDDVTLAPLPAKPERQASVRKFAAVERVFPFGVYGTSGGFRSMDASGAFKEKFPAPLWRTIPDLKRHHINAIMGAARELYSDSPPEHWDELDQALAIYGEHGIYVMPTTYFSRYYRADLDPAVCEAAMRKQAARFRGKNALLGWLIIDEPESSQGALDDFLWAQSVINEVDPTHPVTTGGNMYNYYFDRQRPVVIFDRYPLLENSRAPHSIANITRLIHRDAAGPVWYIAPAFHNISGEYLRPTPAELRLMCYAAIANGAKGLFFYEYRQRPNWLRSACSGLLDPFEVGDGLWDEIGRLGFYLGPLGPLLLESRPLPQPGIETRTEMIEVEWQEHLAAVSVGALETPGRRDRLLLIVYNNDTERPRKAQIRVPAGDSPPRQLLDLFSLEAAPFGGAFDVSLAPGEGRIYLLSGEADVADCKAQVLCSRLTDAKEIATYDAYFGALSGLAIPGAAQRIAQAQSIEELEKIKQDLEFALRGNQLYSETRDRLDAVQQRLSQVNALYEAKITSLESLERSPSRFSKREHDPSRPEVRAFLDGLLEIGACYYPLRNLFLKGAYRDIAPALAELDALSLELAANAQASFTGSAGIRQPAVDLEKVRRLEQGIEAIERESNLPGPGLPALR